MSTSSNLFNLVKPPLSVEFDMSDDALVTFGGPVGADGLSFHDVGFMPVNALTIAGVIPGISVPLPGGPIGMFVRYTADGVQHFANGAPSSADYTSLRYDLVSYTGKATFGHAVDGTPTVSGLLTQVVIAKGDLIAGHLDFDPSGAIRGEVDVTVRSGPLTTGRLNVSVQHAAGDVGHTATGGITLSNGHLVGTFVPALG